MINQYLVPSSLHSAAGLRSCNAKELAQIGQNKYLEIKWGES